jgi:hypothetical protein
MKISQGNSLCSYLYLKQAKMSFSSLFLYEIRVEEGRLGPAQGNVGISGRGQEKEVGG